MLDLFFTPPCDDVKPESEKRESSDDEMPDLDAQVNDQDDDDLPRLENENEQDDTVHIGEDDEANPNEDTPETPADQP